MSIDPEEMAIALRVLKQAEQLPIGSPQAMEIQRATASVYKTVRQRRRSERRAAIVAHDEAVTNRTATGAAGRIDDETEGRLPQSSVVDAPTAGELLQPRACYVCKVRYTTVDAFYHQLCPECAAFNRAKREARTDLTGRRALLTGGRAKIGMYIALRLLRDGAHTTITTRFPRDAARRFAAMEDSADWLHRMRVVGIDLRDPAQVVELADSIADEGPLDILINNAAQTVRRSAQAYSPLAEGERLPLPSGPLPEVLVLGTVPHTATLALTAGQAALEHVHTAGGEIDAGGLLPDLHHTNSWIQHVDEVDPVELLEVQLCNQTAPFILISRLRAALAAGATAARRSYVVNVSAMEGQFSRGYKGPGHPHTNMSKAALNMLTRTSAGEMLESNGILMTAVDTGWITDERPHPTKMRLADEGFHAPLDLVDGAARVYDPIVRGEEGEDLFGCFLKDYRPSPW